MNDIEIVDRYVDDPWYSTGVKEAWGRLKQNLKPSKPEKKSCENCKWKLSISCGEICGSPDWISWEGI